MSAMSPYLSDCMPDERVAIQPPSVLWVKLSGKWPRVQPRRPSCASMSGPSAPAWIRARPDSSSMSSTLFIRPMSSEIDRTGLVGGRLEAAGDVAAAAERDDHRVRGDRLSTICCTSASSAG